MQFSLQATNEMTAPVTRDLRRYASAPVSATRLPAPFFPFDTLEVRARHIGLNDLGREFIFEALVDRLLVGIACIAAERHLRFGFGAVAGRGCEVLPIDPEIIISEQARLGASVAWLGRSYSRACEKLNRPELANEFRWIRSTFEPPGNTEVNFRTLQQQVRLRKSLGTLAVAS